MATQSCVFPKPWRVTWLGLFIATLAAHGATASLAPKARAADRRDGKRKWRRSCTTHQVARRQPQGRRMEVGLCDESWRWCRAHQEHRIVRSVATLRCWTTSSSTRRGKPRYSLLLVVLVDVQESMERARRSLFRSLVVALLCNPSADGSTSLLRRLLQMLVLGTYGWT